MASKSYFVVNIMEYLCDAPMEENFQPGLNDSITGEELLSLAMKQISLLQHRVGGVTRNAKATDKTLLQLLKTI